MDFELEIGAGDSVAHPLSIVRSPAGPLRGQLQFLLLLPLSPLLRWRIPCPDLNARLLCGLRWTFLIVDTLVRAIKRDAL